MNNNSFVHSLVELQARATPDAPAVFFGQQFITYAQLDRRAASLAQVVLQSAENELITGISATRGIDMVVGLLAILKAGKAYLPLPASYPAPYLRKIVADSGIRTVICPAAECSFFGDLQLASIDPCGDQPMPAEIPPDVQPELAYVMYTSCASGMPKGIRMGHAALMNLLDWKKKTLNKDTGRTLQLASLISEDSFCELFTTLSSGGTLIIADENCAADPAETLQLIDNYTISRLFVPFSFLQRMADTACATGNFPLSLQEVVTGGEQPFLSGNVLRFFGAIPDVVCHNQYGVAECQVVAALRLAGDVRQWPERPAIGKARDHVHIYILDEQLKQVPQGAEGELCISGQCLADGYMDHSGAAARQFVTWQHPDMDYLKIIIFRTGDRGRYLADGTIAYTGRNDRQLKIDNYRIHPEETEALILAQPGVLQAFVTTMDGPAANNKLIAYVATTDGQPNDALAATLRQQLPAHMVPAAYVWLHELVVSPNGEVDEHALPLQQSGGHNEPFLSLQAEIREQFAVPGLEDEPEGVSELTAVLLAGATMQEHEPAISGPTLDAEETNDAPIRVRNILGQICGRDLRNAPPDANFIQLGFDSISLASAAVKLHAETGVRVTFRQLMETLNTLERLSDHLDVHAVWPQQAEIQVIAARASAAAAPAPDPPATLTEQQKAFIAALTIRYNKKTARSKTSALDSRQVMADPSYVDNYREETREMNYPVMVNMSRGCRLWDIDGNEYIDALNGMGSSLFGYQPDFVTRAIVRQIERGMETGAGHELAGTLCRLFCKAAGYDRATLCDSVTEAISGAVCLARSVTGRRLVAILTDHSEKLMADRAWPGIFTHTGDDILLLEYGTDDTLNVLKDRSEDLAMVFTAPLQPSRPDVQPVEWLKKVRALTRVSGTLLGFNEAITGFRLHQLGVQGFAGVRADLAVYGSVVTGGLPFGIITGSAEYLDTIDGGRTPATIAPGNIGMLSGPFMAHPIALSAAKATLEQMALMGTALFQLLEEQTNRLTSQLNAVCQKYSVPVTAASYGSMWKIKIDSDIFCGELLYILMREKGVHIWANYPCFMTEAHKHDDIFKIVTAFDRSIQELIGIELFSRPKPEAGIVEPVRLKDAPPVNGARLGRDPDGHPGWFVADKARAGKYLQVH